MRHPLLALAALASFASAQSIVNTYPGTFIDLTTSGGTALTSVSDDSTHDIVTTVGNLLFPAGNVRISNNGVAVSGSTAAVITYGNVAIPATGLPPGISGASHVLCPFWDDLVPATGGAGSTIWWLEAPGILIIQWNDDHHYGVTGLGGITFQIQVFGSPTNGAPFVQFLYPDVQFGGGAASNDFGASATIGCARASGSNAQWSTGTASVVDGSVLSIFGPFRVELVAPLGPGSMRVDVSDGPPMGGYFLAATLHAGVFPSGWFYGVDMPITELGALISFGPPFLGTLDGAGNFSLGPIFGVPAGITFYVVAVGLSGGSPTPTHATTPVAYTTL